MINKLFQNFKTDFDQIYSWKMRQWVAFVAGVIAASLVIGVPTGIVRSTLYTRMTPVLWWNYPVWFITSVLSGVLLASYVRRRDSIKTEDGVVSGASGGLLSVFAVGCPICNKLVVLAIGYTGALQIFAPIQPILGIGSIALLFFAVHKRLGAPSVCAVNFDVDK